MLEAVKTLFIDEIYTRALSLLANLYHDHRLIFFGLMVLLAWGIYLMVRGIIRTPHTIFYILYGILSGAAVVYFGTGPSGLDTARGPDQMAVGLVFGAAVGLIVGLILTIDSDRAPFFWTSVITIPLAVAATCIAGIFLLAAIMMFRDNPIAATLVFAFFGAIIAPVDYVLLIVLRR